jgi:organic hydroperoxide reductase OsmC/OhrA
MSEYAATVFWERGEQNFCEDEYSRGHTWTFDGELEVPASVSSDIVPLPWSVAKNVDPEKAFFALISSCYMLLFLSLVAKRKIVVDRYADSAVGFMEQREDGKIAMTQVILHPDAHYSGDAQPS